MQMLFSLPLIGQALAATLFTWAVTAAGAALVFFTRRAHVTLMDALLGFGAGVMLASSFFSLLSPGIDLAAQIGQLPWLAATAGFLAGSVLLLAGDRLLMRRAPADDRSRRIRLLVTSITLHNIPEGLAVGVAFGALLHGSGLSALMGAWMLAIGIGLQNFPEGAAVSLPLRRDGCSAPRAFFVGQLSGVVEPIAGVAGAVLASTVQGLLPFLLSFAAGAMITVVVSELVPESQRNPRRSLITFATCLGFAVMMLLDVALA